MKVVVSVHGVPVATRNMLTYAPGVAQIVLTPDELYELYEHTAGHPLARVEVTVTIEPREAA